MFNQSNVPNIPDEVVLYFNTIFPQKPILPTTSTNDIMYQAGIRYVIDIMNRLNKNQYNIAIITNTEVKEVTFKDKLYNIYNILRGK